MNRMSAKKWIVFLDFQSLWMILFVFGSGIAGSWSAFFFCFRALKRNDDAGSFLSHGLILKLYFNTEFR